jgi:hypothetical protein
MKKLIFILILSSIVCVKSYSQSLNNKDSVIDEKITKNKFYPFVGFGMSTVEQKIIGPSTNLTSKFNVLNLGIGANYRINEGLMIEGTVLALIGSSFNYYNFNYPKTSLTNLYNTNYTNEGFGFRIPIYRSAFSIFSSSINFNARLLRNKPDFLFFIPNYFFIGPKYDALIGNDKLQLRNYLGFQYGFKYKFSLKYVNIYPSLTISQTPNLYISGTPLVSNITNHYTNFTIYLENKGGVKKFKKYVAPPNLKFSEIPLFKWRNNKATPTKP